VASSVYEASLRSRRCRSQRCSFSISREIAAASPGRDTSEWRLRERRDDRLAPAASRRERRRIRLDDVARAAAARIVADLL
jgi:hypothetical protein